MHLLPSTHNVPMHSMRRRLRPLAIVLAVGTLLFIATVRSYFAPSGSPSSSQRILRDFRHNDNELNNVAATIPKSIPKPPLPQDDNPIVGGSAAEASSNNKNNLGGGPSSHPPSNANQLVLTPEEELGAVIAYLTSLGANARIPSSIDPAKPIDAELIVGFNTQSPRAKAEVKELVSETWNINPVLAFGEVSRSCSV